MQYSYFYFIWFKINSYYLYFAFYDNNHIKNLSSSFQANIDSFFNKIRKLLRSVMSALLGVKWLIWPLACLPDIRLQLLFLLVESKHIDYLSNITYKYAIKLLWPLNGHNSYKWLTNKYIKLLEYAVQHFSSTAGSRVAISRVMLIYYNFWTSHIKM